MKTELNQLVRQGVIDHTLNTKKYPVSLAEEKRIWKGEEGTFSKEDLSGWFRVFNITRIGKVKSYLSNARKSNEKKT